MKENKNKQSLPDTILVVENEVLVRTSIAQYLRHCGYTVIEASSAEEGIIVLTTIDAPIHIVFSSVELSGAMDGFGLAQWVRANKPGIEVVLAGTIVKAAHVAGDLCEKGPHLGKPYEPQQVVEWIKRLRNSPK